MLCILFLPLYCGALTEVFGYAEYSFVNLIGNQLGWGGAWGVKCSDQRQARVRVGDSHHSQNMVGVI